MIVTFYSYKGGVGRTQLVCNIAAYLCFYEEKKVLVIDWDLESPGIHFYFNQLQFRDKGLVNLLSEYSDFVETSDKAEIRNINTWFDSFLSKDLVYSKSKKGIIDFLPAGSHVDKHKNLVEDFDWKGFQRKLKGNKLIESFKKYLKDSKYDYVLIDNRAGINAYSNICNVQIPDAIITTIAPNMQIFEGTKRVIEQIKSNSQIAQKTLIILPVLSRLDASLNKEKGRFIGYFKYYFKEYIHELLRLAVGISIKEFYEKEPTDSVAETYVTKTFLTYQIELAYKEKILFTNTQEKIQIETIEERFARITNMIIAFKNFPQVDLGLLPFSGNLFKMPAIFQGDIWEVYNMNKSVKREVIVITNTKFSSFSEWYQVIPLDNPHSGREHPFTVNVCGRLAVLDLMTTIPVSHFIIKKDMATKEEIQDIRTALFQLFSVN